MCQCAEACQYKSMPFIQLVGDQPVYALIMEVKNENPEKFEKVLPVLGGFHIQTAFLSTIAKRFCGSGLEEWVVAAGIVEAGSVEQATKGKHYKRALCIHKLVYECLVRLLIERRPLPSQSLQKTLEDIKNSGREERQGLVEEILDNPELQEFIHAVFEEIDSADSAMAKYWITYLEMVEILFMNYHALRTRDWDSYLQSIRLMQPWMAVYDNLHYTRYMTVYWSTMNNLNEEWAQFMRDGLFSASLSGRPFSAIPLDQWIEVTMNKGSKMKGGWIGITKNEAMVTIHARTTNKINKVRETLHGAADMNKRKYDHSENTKSRMVKDEQAVQDLGICIKEWESNPWDLDNSLLRTLDSGKVASPKLLSDFETAREEGERLVSEFYEERVLSNTKMLADRISLNKRHSFANPPKEGPSETAPNKTDAMESKAMKDLVVAAQSAALNMKEVMKHRVTDLPLSLFNTNKGIRKNMKSKLFGCFKTDQNVSDQEHTSVDVALIDMGFIWRFCTPSKEERESGFTWGDYAKKVYNTINKRHPNATEIHLINDRYDVVNIKDGEHQRRAGGGFMRGSPNVFPKKDNPVPSPRCFDSFFKNAMNKERLQRFLLSEFQSLASTPGDKVMLYTFKEKCINISTGAEESQFTCHQHEADTRLFFHLTLVEKPGLSVIIDAEDTDVAVIAAHVAHRTPANLYVLRRKETYECKQFCSQEMAEIVIPLHAFTGADAVSGFYGQGKARIYSKVEKSDDARKLLHDLGTSADISSNVKRDMTAFTIRTIYNDAESESLAEARASKWNNMKKKRTAMLPPDPESFDFHLQRANYQAKIWYDYSSAEPPPSPLDNGWHLEAGLILPIIFKSPPMPENLSMLLQSSAEEESSAENKEQEEEEEEEEEEESEDDTGTDTDSSSSDEEDF